MKKLLSAVCALVMLVSVLAIVSTTEAEANSPFYRAINFGSTETGYETELGQTYNPQWLGGPPPYNDRGWQANSIPHQCFVRTSPVVNGVGSVCRADTRWYPQGVGWINDSDVSYVVNVDPNKTYSVAIWVGDTALSDPQYVLANGVPLVLGTYNNFSVQNYTSQVVVGSTGLITFTFGANASFRTAVHKISILEESSGGGGTTTTTTTQGGGGSGPGVITSYFPSGQRTCTDWGQTRSGTFGADRGSNANIAANGVITINGSSSADVFFIDQTTIDNIEIGTGITVTDIIVWGNAGDDGICYASQSIQHRLFARGGLGSDLVMGGPLDDRLSGDYDPTIQTLTDDVLWDTVIGYEGNNFLQNTNGGGRFVGGSGTDDLNGVTSGFYATQQLCTSIETGGTCN